MIEFMERERSIDEANNNEYQSILPEIAELLNVSVSKLEHYPVDMQMLLCRVYINNYQLGKEAAQQALNNVVNLNIPSESQTKAKDLQNENLTQKTSQEWQENFLPSCDEKNIEKRTFHISRKQILHNAKIISNSYVNRNIQENIQSSEEYIKGNNS